MKPLRVNTFAFAIITVFAIFVISGCNVITVRGSGNVIEEERDVEGFNQIELSVPANLFIEQGEQESFRIEGDDNILEMIVTEVVDGSLKIHFEKPMPYNLRPTKDIEIYVGVKGINAIRLSGAGVITANDIETDDLSIGISGASEAKIENLSAVSLDIGISGAGEFDVSGVVEKQTIQISGAGEYRAKGLESKTCDINISGAGEAVVNVSDSLNVKVSGAGSIRYIGEPKVTQSISGAGSVKPIIE